MRSQEKCLSLPFIVNVSSAIKIIVNHCDPSPQNRFFSDGSVLCADVSD